MYELHSNFFQISNAMFHYGLRPNAFTVYCYLVCCTGQKEKCWPSVRTIAKRCGISENTVRNAIKELEERGFISKVKTTWSGRNGKPRRGNNNYYILDLPSLTKDAV